MDAEGSALPHQAIEQHARILGQLVVLAEKFLVFVDDHQQACPRAKNTFQQPSVLFPDLNVRCRMTSEITDDTLPSIRRMSGQSFFEGRLVRPAGPDILSNLPLELTEVG